MAKIVRVPNGYVLAGLTKIGMRLVNEFQRYHPLLCKPAQQPDLRFIRVGSLEQNLQLEKLIANILSLDRENQPKPKPFSKARVNG